MDTSKINLFQERSANRAEKEFASPFFLLMVKLVFVNPRCTFNIIFYTKLETNSSPKVPGCA